MGIFVNQVGILAVIVIVPVALTLMRRSSWLLAWVGFTLFLQVFSASLVSNLPAPRVVGLLYLPFAVGSVRRWIRFTPVKAWMVGFIYLLVLAVLFGFLFPWPDSTGVRLWNQGSAGRSLIQIVRTVADFSLTVFVANGLRRPSGLSILLRALVLGTIISVLVALVGYATNIDFYAIITGTTDLRILLDRPRGLSYEARGLGMACVYSIVILLIWRVRISRYWLLALIINLMGLVVSASTSALGLLLPAMAVMWWMADGRVRRAIAATLATAVGLVVITSIVLPQQFETASTYVRERTYSNVSETTALAGPGHVVTAFAYTLDSLDGAPLLFLLNRPLFALIGTGPGLISLPASDYIPPNLSRWRWMLSEEHGMNTQPTHGVLQLVSDGGLVLLGCWLLQVVSCLRSLRYLSNKRLADFQPNQWRLTYIFFACCSVLFVVQNSPFPVWSIFLGIGWAASRSAAEYVETSHVSEPPPTESSRSNGANGALYPPLSREVD